MNPLLRKLPLMRTCKEVSAMVVAREDRQLNTSEQLTLRLHMAVRSCTSRRISGRCLHACASDAMDMHATGR